MNHAILLSLPLYAKVRDLMAKRMTPAQRRQHYDARAPAPADNRPAILPVTLSGSDTATLKLRPPLPPTCAPAPTP
ncbi:hypothetical protein DFY03_21255 [Escherichia coli]|nr:hypothetical protein [Escherichia coli]